MVRNFFPRGFAHLSLPYKKFRANQPFSRHMRTFVRAQISTNQIKFSSLRVLAEIVPLIIQNEELFQ